MTSPALTNALKIIYDPSTSLDDLTVMAEALKQVRASRRPQLKVGELVCFFARGRTIFGRLVKINPKTYRVKEENGMTWSVAHSLLKKRD